MQIEKKTVREKLCTEWNVDMYGATETKYAFNFPRVFYRIERGPSSMCLERGRSRN